MALYIRGHGFANAGKKVIILFFFYLLSFTLQAQNEWKLERDKDSIKIYSCSVPDSKIRSLKVVCNVESTLSQLAAILLDIKNQDQWFYHTKSSVLKEISHAELYYHAELFFPFPLSNRDFIEHIVLTQDSVTRILTMSVQNLPDFIPVEKGIVRILHSKCNWIVTPTGKKSLRLEFTLFADPGGSIPVWLVNAMSYYGPYETFKKLKYQLLKPEYRYASLPFIKNY